MAFKIPNMLFRACVYPSEDIPGYYVAHCLELDLIGEGPEPVNAIIELIQAIEIQLESCTNPSQFFYPAPNEIWKKYEKSAGRAILQRIIKKALSAKTPANYHPRFERVVATNAVPPQYIGV
jgi:hypothetical protein